MPEAPFETRRSADARRLTPPAVARRYGVNVNKVLNWIRDRELRAVNVAASTAGRPRWVISEEDLAAFEERRTSRPVQAPAPRRRRDKAPKVMKFF